MKCVLVLCLVALCYAEVPLTPTTAPSVTFGEDGTITITGADGKRVVISNSIGNPGRKNVEISVPDPLGKSRTIKVNQDYNVRTINIDDPITGNQPLEGGRSKRSTISKSSKESKKGKSEAEILDEIFRDYRGAVDLKSYEKVLKEIDSYVKSGDLDSSIYKVLKSFAQYEALSPEESYLGQSTLGSESGIGYSSRLAFLQNYLNRANGEQQGLNVPWIGAKRPVSELYQGPVYSGVTPYWYKGMNGAGLQEYRDFYGQQLKNQQTPVQDAQQYLQQKWQPSYEPYQQQVLQQQQWTRPQSLWSLPKQQLVQGQEKYLWNPLQRQQQLIEPQQLTQAQLLQSQQLLTQPREQLNSLLPKRQLVQELTWNQVQKPQQYYGPQQQYYEPQQQYYGPQQQYYKSQQVYYGPQQQYYDSQQQRIDSQGYQLGKQLENQVYPQSQQIPNEQLWALSEQQLAREQQLAQEQQRLPLSRGQQIQSSLPLGNYWQRLWAPQMRQIQYPVNLPVV